MVERWALNEPQSNSRQIAAGEIPPVETGRHREQVNTFSHDARVIELLECYREIPLAWLDKLLEVTDLTSHPEGVINRLADPTSIIGFELNRVSDVDALNALRMALLRFQSEGEQPIPSYTREDSQLVADHITSTIQTGKASSRQWITIFRAMRNFCLLDPVVYRGALWPEPKPEVFLKGMATFFSATATKLEPDPRTQRNPGIKTVREELRTNADLFSTLLKSRRVLRPTNNIPLNLEEVLPYYQLLVSEKPIEIPTSPACQSNPTYAIAQAYATHRFGFDPQSILTLCRELPEITGQLFLVMRQLGLVPADRIASYMYSLDPTPTRRDVSGLNLAYHYLGIPDLFKLHQAILSEYLYNLESQGIVESARPYAAAYGVPYQERHLPPREQRKLNLPDGVCLDIITLGGNPTHLGHYGLVASSVYFMGRRRDGHNLSLVSPNETDVVRDQAAQLKELPARRAVAEATFLGNPRVIVDYWGNQAPDTAKRITTQLPQSVYNHFGIRPGKIRRVCGYEKAFDPYHRRLRDMIQHLYAFRQEDVRVFGASLEQVRDLIMEGHTGMVLPIPDYSGRRVRALINIINSPDGQITPETRIQARKALEAMTHPLGYRQIEIGWKLRGHPQNMP